MERPKFLQDVYLPHRVRKTKQLAQFICPECKKRFIAYKSDVEFNRISKCFNCRQKKKTKPIIMVKRIHGYGHHPLSHVWYSMMYRCYKKENKQYKNYGGRGIKVCKEWHDFIKFIEWAKDKWKQGLQIDRINNNKGYCPENCRFVHRTINTRNTRKDKRNKTGYTGVFFDKKNNKYTSSVYSDGINIMIGSFNSKTDAAVARNEFIKKYEIEGFNLQQIWKI